MDYDDMRIFYQEEIEFSQSCCDDFSEAAVFTSDEISEIDQLVELGVLPF